MYRSAKKTLDESNDANKENSSLSYTSSSLDNIAMEKSSRWKGYEIDEKLERNRRLYQLQQNENQRRVNRDTEQNHEQRNKSKSHDIRSFIQTLQSTNENMEKITSAIKCVQNYVANEAEMEPKALNIILAPYAHKIQFQNETQNHELVGKEELELQQNILVLREAFFNCVKEIADCFERRKNAYSQQLKHLRETSNTATRTAIQMERNETLTLVTKLKTDFDRRYRDHVSKLEEQLAKLQKHSFELEETLLSQQDHIKILEEKDKNRIQLQEQAVDEAIKKYQFLIREENAQQRQAMREELQNVKNDCERQLHRSEQLFQNRVEEIMRADQEKREYLMNDKQRLQEENQSLRDHIAKISIEAGINKEKLILQMREEGLQAEKNLQEQLARAIQVQAELKSQHAEMMQTKQREFREIEEKHELALKQLTEKLAHDHALQIQKLQDQQREAMKNFQAEVNVKMQDQLIKIKHAHDQELKRQIRENERLQRFLQRTTQSVSVINGVTDNLPPQSTTTTSQYPHTAISSNTNPVYQNLTPNHQQTVYPGNISPLTMRAKVSFSPTSSRLQPTFQGVNSAASSPINIPSLEAKHGPVFSPNHLPPEDFTLNEGLAGTVRNGHARDGLGISSNSNRVTSYMKALEDYLQGHDDAQFPLEQAFSELQMKKSDLVPNSLLRSEDTSSNNQSSNNMHKVTDSDTSDDTESEDLFGANLAANLSESIIHLSAHK